MIIRGCDFPEDRYYHPDINVWLKEEVPGVVLLGAAAFICRSLDEQWSALIY